MRRILFILCLTLLSAIASKAIGAGRYGMYQHAVSLTGYTSPETGKVPVAYLWLPQDVKTVRAAILCQQNMTEEAILKNSSFQQQMQQMGIAMIWVAPAFNNNWDPQSGCQAIFERMMQDLAHESQHPELQNCAIIPLGHSAQATFPWNFAAWNPQRTLCILSYHGDAPRTNLCGYGRANIEWGRTRNIDGIPGLMVEGEYEWWEARVRPALAFRMMYPGSCISFLCDTGRGHFDCAQETADYIALFIRKSMELRMREDGTLQPVDPRRGYLFSRYHSDMLGTDGDDKGKMPEHQGKYQKPRPYGQMDDSNCFWYPDLEMAQLTLDRYSQSRGKLQQYVSILQDGHLVENTTGSHGALAIPFRPTADGITFHLSAVSTDSTHQHILPQQGKTRIEVISGPVRQVNDTTFTIYPYECGWDNPRRAFTVWLAATVEADKRHKGAVRPFSITLPNNIYEKLK